MKADSGVGVYLPSRLRVYTAPSRVRGTVAADDGVYDLQLGIGRRCGAANACYLANFAAIRGEKPGLGRRVKLARGATGYWKPITCGVSCSPAEIQFVRRGVLYSIATKGVTVKKEKATLVKLANSAIEAGPR